MMRHDLFYVQRVMTLLEAQGIVTWLFGGWAEELHGLIPPRVHQDVDLLYRGDSFAPVDRYLRAGEVQEITAKRFPHKRAFMLDGVMTEIFLVRPDLTADFWGWMHYVWPPDTLDVRCGGIRVASSAALSRYRAMHDLRQEDPTNAAP